jgi:NADPH:quinone reductase-like Zn-dependent oxidoreductase
MPSNPAAWLTSSNTKSLEVKSAPYPTPKANTIVIKNGAIAINPIDCLIQDHPGMVFPHLKLPFVIGSDVAGEVVGVGPGVTRFKIGDRVLGQARGVLKTRNVSSEGAFQAYTVLLPDLTSQIPDSLSFESAAVIPLGLSTAITGLFQDDQLALQLPSVPAKPPTGKTLLVWGGSTSVGSNAIQLAIAAGYEVFTVCKLVSITFSMSQIPESDNLMLTI